MFNKKNISTRIIIVISLFSMLLIALAAVSLMQLKTVREDLKNIADHEIPFIQIISEVTKYQLEQAVSFQRAVRFGKFMLVNEDAKQSYIKAKERYNALDNVVSQSLLKAKAFIKTLISNINDDKTKKTYAAVFKNLDQADKKHREYKKLADTVFQLILSHEYSNMEQLAQNIENEEDLLNSQLRLLLKDTVEKTKLSTEEISNQQQHLQNINYISFVIIIIFAIFISLTISRSIINPLQYSLHILKQIAQGKKHLRFTVKSHDEVGKFSATMNNMLDTIQLKEKELLEINAQLEERVAQRTLELEEKNELLDQNNRKLEKLNLLKNEFLGMAAHDLRNPLALVSGYLDLLINKDLGQLEDKQLSVLTTLKKHGKQMLSLVNNLLDISVIESGNLTLELKKVENLKNFLEESYQANLLLAKAKSIDLNVNLSDNLPAVHIDAERINQVITNLVTNAIKYSHKNTNITLEAFRSDGFVQVSIKDQGQGIPEDELPNLFGKFTKTSTRSTAGEKSTGLGLAIVKKIIEGHQCKIWVESKHGQGSVFSFTLPAAPITDTHQ